MRSRYARLVCFPVVVLSRVSNAGNARRLPNLNSSEKPTWNHSCSFSIDIRERASVVVSLDVFCRELQHHCDRAQLRNPGIFTVTA